MTAAIEARGLTRTFADDIAVSDVDLRVDGGEIHAVVGLNGAGKTTLMRMLLGMVRPDRGTALIRGADATTLNGDGWAEVGHLIESPFAYGELTVRQNLRASALLRGQNSREVDSAVDRSVERFGLERWADRRARTLSLGNRQRLGLAAATIHDPAIVVLDEPANALDPAGVVFTRELLGAYAAEGRAVLVSSHHLDEIARVAHRITVMHRGRIVGTLAPGAPDLERKFFEIALDADEEGTP